MKQLLDYNYEEIEKIVLDLGEKKFRAKQLFEWLNKGAEFSEMKNLPASFIKKLEDETNNEFLLRISKEGEVMEFKEKLPSMNDIFIKTVSANE